MTVRVLGLKSGTTAEDHRLGMSIFTPPLGGVLQRRSGLIYHPDACVLTGVSAMQAKVSPFIALVDGTAHPLQSAYPVVSDADVTITFDAAEASVDRVDRIIVRVKDGAYDGSGAQEGTVEYLKGQPSGAAADPPPSSLVLWEVKVVKAVTTIDFATAATRAFVHTTGLGSPLPVRDVAERDRLPAYDTLTVLRLDTGALQQRWQGAWRTITLNPPDPNQGNWMNLPNQPGMTYPITPRVRRRGKIVELRGSADPVDTATVISRLPLTVAPAHELRWAAPAAGATVAHLVLATDGTLSVPRGQRNEVRIDATWTVG
ncbi:hypothetical protein ACGFNU_01830 [Spirillospora sp. NPDC048911]|uniref:hypothetical protein n=1 Tax=Spirillospora sp. NPDC048911 TaxID=3364527 RepID=UPI003713203F